MNRRLKSLLTGWLIHFFVIYALTVSFVSIVYIHNSSIYGYYQADTHHKLMDGWHYFLHQCVGHGKDYLLVLLFTLITEMLYLFLFRRLILPIYIGLSLFTMFCVLQLLWTVDWRMIFQWRSIVNAVGIFFYATIYSVVYSLVRDYFYNIQFRKDLQIQQSTNELTALKAQLNPHFLFNSLNYLYGNALNENAPVTADGIDKLSAMMRYTIVGVHKNFVPLADELDFLGNYLTLQQARIPQRGNIKIKTDIQQHPADLRIAPLLLLPFIENAFKYGISMDEPSKIDLKIHFSKSEISLELTNIIVHNQSLNTGNNTGIRNTVKRLELLYAHNYKLNYGVVGNKYNVLLKIKLKP